MIEVWAQVTLGAAFLQCIRTALQKRLKGRLSTNGANLVRYVYGAPLAALAFALALHFGGAVPKATGVFLLYAMLGGIAQIIATSFLINALSQNFTTGTAYSKTEALQAALLMAVVAGEHISVLGWLAIIGGLAGVLLISLKQTPSSLGSFAALMTGRGAGQGVASGFFFGLSSIFIRLATVELTETDRLTASLATLATVTGLQLCLFVPFVLWREPGEVRRVLQAWRPAGLVGFLSVTGSAGWFYAFAIQQAAYVRALGQAELVFTFLISTVFFRENLSRREAAGVVVTILSVVTILLARTQ